MKRFVRASCQLASMLFACFTTAVGAAAVPSDSASHPQVGVLTDNYPFSFKNEAGQMEGFVYELTEAIEEVMGLHLTRVEGSTEEINGAFMTGRLEMVQSYARFDERERYADFSVPYLTMSGAIFVKASETRIASLTDLKGRKVMVHRGSLGEAILRRAGLEDSVVYVDSVEQALLQLDRGENDATLVTRLSALALAQHRGLTHIRALETPVEGYDVHYCYAVRAGDRALLAKVNEGLAVLVRTGRFDRIYDKWFSHLEPTKYSALDVMLAVSGGLGLALAIALSSVVRQRRLQKRIERQAEALRFSEERHRAIFEGAHDGLLVLAQANPGGDFRIEQINPAARRLLNPAIDQASDQSLRRVLVSEPELLTKLCAIIEQRDSTEFEYARSANAGWWRVSVNPLGARTLVAIADVTEAARARERLREQEGQLRHAQKLEAIGTLAGGVAHDFNNLLTAIMGNTELCLMTTPQDQADAHSLNQVLRAARRARQLVKQILTFSRRTEPSREVLAVSPIIEETVNFLRSVSRGAVEIEHRRAASLPGIVADSGQLHQVLMNIGTNAVQAMRGAPGRLTIDEATVRIGPDEQAQYPQLKPGQYVRIGIQDTGPGIPPHVQERMFEPYFTTKAPGEGTGLGLSVVHGIVHQHGGTVTVYSQPGRGTLFNVYFPVAPADESAVENDELTAVTPGRGELILLVDDDVAVINTAQQILTRLGYRVSAHTQSTAALGEFEARATEIAAVVSDLSMPELNGLQLAARMRARQPRLPFILASGFFSQAESDESETLNVTHRLYKPLTYVSLGRAVAGCLNPFGSAQPGTRSSTDDSVGPPIGAN